MRFRIAKTVIIQVIPTNFNATNAKSNTIKIPSINVLFVLNQLISVIFAIIKIGELAKA